jgi:hypothetical protein
MPGPPARPRSAEAEALLREWTERGIPVPLKVLNSPYRDVTGPVLEFVKDLRMTSPRDLVAVFIPEYVVGRWWETLLHNQSALRLKARLLFVPGVMVTNVPWQLGSAEQLEARRAEPPLRPPDHRDDDRTDRQTDDPTDSKAAREDGTTPAERAGMLS